MEKLRAGVIGLGRIGSTFDDEIIRGGTFFLPYCHASSYAESPHVELVSGADPDNQQRKWFADRWELPENQVYSDYQEMIEKEKLDIISVCTSARPRSTIVQTAAELGVRGIWAEKPMAISLSEADSMIKVCRDHGTVLAVNCHRRWNAYFNEIKQMINQGEFGKLLQLTVHGSFGLSSNGSHMIDTMNFLAEDQIEWVFGEIQSDESANSNNEVFGNGYFVYKNGVRGFVRSMSPGGAALTSFDIIGEKARATTGDDGMTWHLTKLIDSDVNSISYRPLSQRHPGPLAVEFPFPLPAKLVATGLSIVENIVDCIGNGEKPLCSGEDGAAALEAAIAIRESHRLGGVKIELPIKDRELKIFSGDTKNDNTPNKPTIIPQ